MNLDLSDYSRGHVQIATEGVPGEKGKAYFDYSSIRYPRDHIG